MLASATLACGIVSPPKRTSGVPTSDIPQNAKGSNGFSSTLPNSAEIRQRSRCEVSSFHFSAIRLKACFTPLAGARALAPFQLHYKCSRTEEIRRDCSGRHSWNPDRLFQWVTSRTDNSTMMPWCRRRAARDPRIRLNVCDSFPLTRSRPPWTNLPGYSLSRQGILLQRECREAEVVLVVVELGVASSSGWCIPDGNATELGITR